MIKNIPNNLLHLTQIDLLDQQENQPYNQQVQEGSLLLAQESLQLGEELVLELFRLQEVQPYLPFCYQLLVVLQLEVVRQLLVFFLLRLELLGSFPPLQSHRILKYKENHKHSLQFIHKSQITFGYFFCCKRNNIISPLN